MTKSDRVQFRVLGPLELLIGGEPVALGGAKQRAVLAVLLLRAGEVVPVERLIDDVWGETAPPSAAHSLEAYVSRIRQLLNGSGPTLVRRGAGYVLVLSGVALDAHEFEALAEEAWGTAAEGRYQESTRLATRALELWRGPVLADVALASSGRAEAERLEELRLRTFEQLVDAELALGHHEAIVGKLQTLVGQNPYRERFVAQLMLALYRCGRHAEALDAYEQTRRRLDDDLGLQPSAELRELSGQIVRQEPQLRRPRPSGEREPLPASEMSRGPRRLAGLAFAGAAVAAMMVLTASGAAALPASDDVMPMRVALVQDAASDPVHLDRVSAAFRSFADSYDYEYETLLLDASVGSRVVALERLRHQIEKGRFALVLTSDETTARAVSPQLAENPGRTYVFLDASLQDLGLAGEPNASAIRFRDEQSSRLAGYMSALIHPRLARGARVDSVVVVAGPRTPHTERVVRGYLRGLRHAKRPIEVRVVRSAGTKDVTECEGIANAEIDAGAEVVFAAAGSCGLGAIAVARARGIWAIGAEEIGLDARGGILGITTKDWSRAMHRALSNYDVGLLPFGRDDNLGLEDDYGVFIEAGVPESVWSKVIALCSKIRLAAATGA